MTGPGTPELSLSRLADELTAVGQRLAWIGTELRRADAAARAYPAAPAAPSTAPLSPSAPAPRRPGLLEREGASSRLLAWVGGAVTLLGVLLLLVLAVQRGWLGPLPRVLGGATLALALVGVADTLARGRTRRPRPKVEAEIDTICAPRWVARVIRTDLTATRPRRCA